MHFVGQSRGLFFERSWILRHIDSLESMLLHANGIVVHVRNELVSLGYPKHYNVENPFEWMDMISMQGKTNFFESRVSSYQKANVMQSVNGPQLSSKTFDMGEDF